MRQIGKVLELSMGYAGGIGAFQSMAKIYGVQVELMSLKSYGELIILR
jgi:DNA polymerase